MPTADPLLKTKPVAEALGVSVSTVKRWVDSGSLPGVRTVGRHRLVPYSEVLKFAGRQGFSVQRLESLAEAAEGVRAATDEDAGHSLLSALVAGDRKRARAILFAFHASGGGVAALAAGVIRPVMERIGHGWMVGGLDVFQEHQATRIVSDALGTINDRLAQYAGADSPLSLGAAPEGDFYQLPLALGELVLREVGWDVRNLGANLPARSLVGAITGYRPRLVFLSISYIVDEARFVREYEGVLEAARSVGAAIMLGGRALSPELRARTVCAGFGDRMSHLSEFARRLVPKPDARSGVQDVPDLAPANPTDAPDGDPDSPKL